LIRAAATAVPDAAATGVSSVLDGRWSTFKFRKWVAVQIGPFACDMHQT